MVKYKIIDNFLPMEEFQILKDAFYNSDTCPWYFCEKENSLTNYDGPELDAQKFIHGVYHASVRQAKPGWSHSGPTYVAPIIRELNVLLLYRIKMNLMPIDGEVRTCRFHVDNIPFVDAGIKYSQGILYLNTCNGFTILEDGTKIETIENRMLIIPGNCKHAGTTSSDDRRVLVNINFVNSETNSLYEQE